MKLITFPIGGFPVLFPTRARGGGGAALYTISGTVYDADGSTAVSGATVALGAYSAVSGVDGTFTISDIPAGTSASMTCTKTGYSWAAKTIAAMSGNLTAQNYTNAWWAGAGCAAICQGAYEAVAAASQAASYVNKVNPGTNDLTTAAAPTWSATNGWTFNGSTQYLDTGILPDSNQTDSIVIQFQGASTTEFKTICGSLFTGDGSEYAIYPNTSGGVRYENGATSIGRLDVSPSLQTGNLIIAGRNTYRNGVSDGTIPASTPAQAWPSMYIGASNLKGVGVALAKACKVQAFAQYSDILSSTQAAMIYAGIQAQGFFLAP